MNINDFMTLNPKHPLTDILDVMRSDCPPAEYEQAQGMASGMVLLLHYQGQLDQRDSVMMLAQIGSARSTKAAAQGRHSAH
jgi:hypothetical protein